MNKGFFSVKMKLLRLVSALGRLFSLFFNFPFDTSNFHSTGVPPPQILPFVSDTTVEVFECTSHRL
jgi:hypothetical protein